MTVEDYLNLITSAYRDKPKFTAMVSNYVSLPVRVQDLLALMIPLFDVDSAVGSQLDIIGLWVGITRDVNIPTAGIYFSWDGTNASQGWDLGTWQGNLPPSTITELPDDAYRTLIKAKIAANKWDGTTTNAYVIWDSLFPNLNILIQDYQDMSYALIFVGTIIDALTVAIITGGYIPLKPEGVQVVGYYIPSTTGPIFGWDINTDFMQGWDQGAWATFYSA